MGDVEAVAAEVVGFGDGRDVGGVVADEDGGFAGEGWGLHEGCEGVAFIAAAGFEFEGAVGGEEDGIGGFADQAFGELAQLVFMFRGAAVVQDEAEFFFLDEDAGHGLGVTVEDFQPVLVGGGALHGAGDVAGDVAQQGSVLGGAGQAGLEQGVDIGEFAA